MIYVSTLQIQFIMHFNECKGFIFVLPLNQNIIFFIYGEFFTLSPCTSQIGQDSGTRSFAVPGMLPQETQYILACTGTSQLSLCKRGKGRV